MLTLMKDLKIVGSMASVINALTFLKSALTVGIIVFSVLEFLSAMFKINSNELSDG